MIITIDGPSASGKSTVSMLIAKRLGYYYLYSGLMYRAVSYIFNQKGIVIDDSEESHELVRNLIFSEDFSYEYDPESKFPIIIYQGTDITSLLKSPEVDRLASSISQYESVRSALLKFQRTVGDRYDCVADGRDCGTVVFPHAQHKFFLTASQVVRAKRWQMDQLKKGNDYSLERAQEEIGSRDKRDMERVLSPLRQAGDALLVDNSDLSVDQTVDLMLYEIENR